MAVWRMKYLKADSLMDSCSERIADTVPVPLRCTVPVIGERHFLRLLRACPTVGIDSRLRCKRAAVPQSAIAVYYPR